MQEVRFENAPARPLRLRGCVRAHIRMCACTFCTLCPRLPYSVPSRTFRPKMSGLGVVQVSTCTFAK